MKPILLTIAMALAMTASACGGATTGTPAGSDGQTMNDHGNGRHGTFAFGRPADASDATRTIQIDAKDSLAFDPPAITVRKGEIVTLKVTNAGKIDHDFALGDEEFQTGHAEQMAGGNMHMGDQTNAFTVEPGRTKSLTWEFTEAGTVLYGCHVSGHYEAGMKGTVTVS